MAEHACILCKKKHPGRFTTPSSGAENGTWNKGRLPAWYGWTCLPEGDGRGETMPKKTTVPAVIDIPSAKPGAMMVDKKQGLALLGPLESAVTALGISILTAEEYAEADAVFGRIKLARKTWKLRMYGTPAKPGPIPAIRSGLDQLYALNREVDKPLEALENGVEARMKGFKLRELQESRRIQQEQEEAAAEAQRQIDELTARQEALKTPAARAKVEQQIIEVAEELDAIQQEIAPETVVSVNSRDQVKKIPTVPNLSEFIRGVAKGLIPEDCLMLNMVKLRAYYKEDPGSVAEFPGVVIEDDIQIVGR